MDESSMKISAEIGEYIAMSAPVIEYSEDDAAKAREFLGDDGFAELCDVGLCDGDFEKFYVVHRFWEQLKAGDGADGGYIIEFFKNAKKLSADEFLKDKYLSAIKINERKKGKISLRNISYERGEIFQYDMPSFRERYVVPKIGFFTEKVSFPALYNGDIPWVSVCPSEMNSMAPDIERAHGKVLVLGLGLGYYAYMISEKENVSDITVVDIDERVIELFRENILPQFKCANKINIVCADAVEYVKEIKEGEYDFCYADIWEGVQDGAPLYSKIKEQEKRFRGTEFRYWIEEQIEDYKAYCEE